MRRRRKVRRLRRAACGRPHRRRRGPGVRGRARRYGGEGACRLGDGALERTLGEEGRAGNAPSSKSGPTCSLGMATKRWWETMHVANKKVARYEGACPPDQRPPRDRKSSSIILADHDAR